MTRPAADRAILTPLSPDTFRSKPWKNGGGVTQDIADACRPGVDPAGWEGMIWRLGRTAIVQPGPFSDLTGYERMQAVVVGSGLVLEGAHGEIDLRRPFRPVRYNGGARLVSRLENGPVEVVNLIADRALCTLDMVAPVAGAEIALRRGVHILYAPGDAAQARCDEMDVRVEPGWALRIDVEDEIGLTLTAGQALLATIRPR